VKNDENHISISSRIFSIYQCYCFSYSFLIGLAGWIQLDSKNDIHRTSPISSKHLVAVALIHGCCSYSTRSTNQQLHGAQIKDLMLADAGQLDAAGQLMLGVFGRKHGSLMGISCNISSNIPTVFQITLLRVITTLTFIHFVTGKSSGILSDILFGI
jgi:hypothetical protein